MICLVLRYALVNLFGNRTFLRRILLISRIRKCSRFRNIETFLKFAQEIDQCKTKLSFNSLVKKWVILFKKNALSEKSNFVRS